MHETHCHSRYSGDVDKQKGGTIDDLCRQAVNIGLESIAVTDHLEIQQIMGNIFPPLDNEGIFKDITKAKEKYKGVLEVVYGVELAQACHDLEKTDNILAKYKYDYIIGSVHAVRGFPDFSDMEYSAVPDRILKHAWELYVSELEELADWGNIDTLAHITYPYRYFKRHSRENLINLFEKGREYFEPILRKIIKKGIALEVNTSGLWQDTGISFPHNDLIMFYKELGGKMVTVGSDAHYPGDLAKCIPQTYSVLKDLGFETVITFRERKPVFHKL
ncbi:MAG: histidinol-phosphatase HisJ family protein [Clostridiales bacterium]|jgi:histidinol-phosphatase (PHP family)|nr:histidinol-phosphatase HisJ family protein [Clostridiales bacterium]